MESDQLVEASKKVEVQKKIIELSDPKSKLKTTESEILNILKILAPGTHMRTALEGIVKIGKGALIVVENNFTTPILDGGFKINCRLTPQRLMELSKMDGAIVISNDMKKILYSNVLLTPDSKIKTNETGTRHKAGERTAKMTGALVLAVSERRKEINFFYKNIKYTLHNAEEVLRKANEQIQLIEKQRDLFDKYVDKLNKVELQNYHTVDNALDVVQKGQMINKLSQSLQKNIIELGKEGTILKTRLKEITQGVEKEVDFVIKDYTKIDLKKSKTLLNSLSYDELLERNNLLRVLAYEDYSKDKQIKGWRMLSRTSLEDSEIALLVKEAGSLGKAINSPLAFYKSLLPSEKAEKIKNEIEKIKLQTTY